MREKDYLNISKMLRQICDKTTNDYQSVNPNVRFCLYQDIDKYEIITPFSALDIAMFYNKNWTGNEDYMHIPNYNKVLEYIRTYPVIVAYNKTTKEILGISTLKYDEITNKHIDPYFPEPGARYFSMTGVLTNPENSKNGLRGIGNKIYEIELAGALLYKQLPGCNDTRIVCVIDCRNKHSIYAVKNAAENLGKNLGMEMKNTEFPATVAACYFIIDSNNKLTEAPTLVIEVGLDPVLKTKENPKKLVFNQGKDLNRTLLATVLHTFKADEDKDISVNEDRELGVDVTYVRFDKEANQLKNFSPIITNGTEKGNDRVPLSDKELIAQAIDERLINKQKIKKLILPDSIKRRD